jgi:alpha-mannosidase
LEFPLSRFRLHATALIGSVLILASFGALESQQHHPSDKPVLYVVSTAHLDTQWNWTVQDTIREYVPDTFYSNFALFERFPNYVFTWEGAIHYMWFKEYHPQDWPRVKQYVDAGRWRPAGSWINAVDVNTPSPESLFRQALYGKRFFRQEFGRTSQDIYLPDCFGFGFALPSIAAHSGLTAFSTQKLTWGAAVAAPFAIGRWRGVDGNWILAALRPGDYTTRLQSDISSDPAFTSDLVSIGGGRRVGLRYFGVGDVGGAPSPESVAWLEKATANRDGKVRVVNTSADQLSRDLMPEQKLALAEYEGELLLKTHAAGTYTSQAVMKRFNRANELLADAAERASVAADVMTALPYPRERLREAWIRTLWHQFHDDLTGTSIPQAYQFSWNDELVSLNQFSGVLTSAASAIAALMDTRATGVPIVAYNPLSWTRRDAVEADIEFDDDAPEYVRVIDTESGRDVPAQVLEREGRRARIVFVADMPSVAFKVLDVQRRNGPPPSSLRTGSRSLESSTLRVTVDENGDVSSVYDKSAGRELLLGPIRLELRDNPSPAWPAWEILWNTVRAAPREIVRGGEVRILENGPARVTLEISRQAFGSSFVQRLRLVEGGDRVEVENLVDWRSPNTLLKAAFPLAASNPRATYDLGLGTIQRGNNHADRYEVPAQQWADITDVSGEFGVAIANDSKHGWDKPDDHTLRLTLLHTPRPTDRYTYQSSNDLGRHRFVYAIAGHRGDWRDGRIQHRAAAINQPLVAFQSGRRDAGPLGRSFSFLSVDGDAGQIAVKAIKKAEDSDEIVLRVQELFGRPAHGRVRFAAQVAHAREINAAEEEVGGSTAGDKGIEVALKPYQPRTFALTFTPLIGRDAGRSSTPLALPFNLDGISTDSDRADGDFDGKKQTMAGELLPASTELNGVTFTFGPTTPRSRNVLVPRGQQVRLPRGPFNRVYLLAAAVGGDVNTTIAGQHLTVREWQGPIGQWDSRLKSPRLLREQVVTPATEEGGAEGVGRGRSGAPRRVWTRELIENDMAVAWDKETGAVSGIDRIAPGFVKRDEIGWVGTHRHGPHGNQPYIASYLFLYPIDLAAGTRTLRLPNEPRLRILAATAVNEPPRVRPAGAPYAADLPEPPRALFASPQRLAEPIDRAALAAQVKAEFVHAWEGYKRYAWGHDELKPVSRQPHDWHAEPLHMTAVDALSTMLVMGMKDEAARTIAYLVDNLSFDKDIVVKNFEITIRILGGLLSVHQTTGDRRLLALAEDLGKRLLPVFDSPTGMPYMYVNLRTGRTSGPETNPAEIGTLILEFGTLSRLTGNPVFFDRAKRALAEVHRRRDPTTGLVGEGINVETGAWTDASSHIGGAIDSFYEYLLKCERLFGDADCGRMWKESIEAVNRHLADDTADGLWYGHSDMTTGKRTATTYGSLHAFFPGVLAMSGDLGRARRLQESGYRMWRLHGIEPEAFDYRAMKVVRASYQLRPEIVESAYYLWRYTKDPRYVDMGREFFNDLRAHCRTDAGYTILEDVVSKRKGDLMHSFFLAETLKYLYLLFEPAAIDFDEVVFNTEAHPLRVK